MLVKPNILSLFPNLFNKFKKKREHSCNILYIILNVTLPFSRQSGLLLTVLLPAKVLREPIFQTIWNQIKLLQMEQSDQGS